jgi:hypothetical protein
MYLAVVLRSMFRRVAISFAAEPYHCSSLIWLTRFMASMSFLHRRFYRVLLRRFSDDFIVHARLIFLVILRLR